MAENKHQHYLPAFYLYNFTSEIQRLATKDKSRRDTNIYHVDLKKGCILERPIKKVAIEPYLYSHKCRDGNYDHSLDKEIQIVENKASRAIQYFSDILIFALKKKPSVLEIKNCFMDDIMDLLFWQIKRHPGIINDLRTSCEQFLLEKGRSLEDAKAMALEVIKTIGSEGENDIKNELMKKNKVIICTSSPKALFITSDKPFVRFNKSGGNGVAVEGTEMYFPLTSNMLLFMHQNGNRREFRLENDRTFLRKLNAYTARSASNYLFCRSKTYLEKIVKVNS